MYFNPGIAIYVGGVLTQGISSSGLDLAFAEVVGSAANIAALRALTTTSTVTVRCQVLGYYSTADGGEGIFVYVATDTTSADNDGTIIVDASGRRWYRLTGGRITAAMFGCDMTGATDSTTAFQAALSYASAINGALYIGAGTIQISSVSLNANTKELALIGAGRTATTISTNSATANVMTLTLSQMVLRDFMFSSSVTRTAGSYLASTGNIEVFEGLGFNGHYVGITGTGNDGTWRDFLWTNPATNAVGAVVNGYPNAVLIDNPSMYQGSFQASAGINLQNCSGGVIINNPEIVGQGDNLLINPGTGQGCYSLQVHGGYLDSGVYGVAINPTGNGIVARAKFVGVETNSNTGHGVLIENNGTSIVQGVEFIGHMGSLNAAGSGIYVTQGTGSAPAGVSIVGGTFAANTNGISIGSGVSDFTITGVQAGAYGGMSANSAYGIIVAAGASDRYVITNNRLTGNTTASLSDTGTGTHKTVAGNPPYNPIAPINLTVSASPFVYTNNKGNTCEMLVFGGTISAVEINGVTVATATDCAVTLPQGQVLTVVYSATPTVQLIGT
jgi:hypothetical protein